MNRDETARIRRELGLDLIEAARKAGANIPAQRQIYTVSDSCDNTADKPVCPRYAESDHVEARHDCGTNEA